MVLKVFFTAALLFHLTARGQEIVRHGRHWRHNPKYGMPLKETPKWLYRAHCFGYHMGEAMALTGGVPAMVTGYALQGYNGGPLDQTGQIVFGVCFAGVGLAGLGLFVMHLGQKHEAHHPEKFFNGTDNRKWNSPLR